MAVRFLLSMGIGALTGFLSGLGVGGGTLLILCLTAFFGLAQQAAQGINLLYFLPTAGIAAGLHLKNGLVDKSIAVRAIPVGLVTAGLSAWLAAQMDTTMLQKIFSLLLAVIGLRELFRKNE